MKQCLIFIFIFQFGFLIGQQESIEQKDTTKLIDLTEQIDTTEQIVEIDRYEILFKNLKDIKKNRYDDYKGSCYLFEDWVEADLFDINGLDFRNVLVNYNGFLNNLEANNRKAQYIDVKSRTIKKVVIHDIEKTGLKEFMFLDSLVLVSFPYPSLNTGYYIKLHEDGIQRLFLEYQATVSTVIQRPPGSIDEVKTFYKKYKMALIDGGKVHKFSLRKKAIRKALGEYGDVEKWFKRKRSLKMASFEGVVAFMKAH